MKKTDDRKPSPFPRSIPARLIAGIATGYIIYLLIGSIVEFAIGSSWEQPSAHGLSC